MKAVIFILLVLSASYGAEAQSTFSNTGSGLNDITRFIDPRDSISDDNEIVTRPDASAIADLNGATIEVTDDEVIFDGLPDRLVTVHLTDADGELLLSRSISNMKNTIGIKRLGAGVFYITLIYKEDRRNFTIERY